MPKRKEPENFAPTGEKDIWQSYSLQALSPSKFVTVVAKILNGRYLLLRPRLDGDSPHPSRSTFN